MGQGSATKYAWDVDELLRQHEKEIQVWKMKYVQSLTTIQQIQKEHNDYKLATKSEVDRLEQDKSEYIQQMQEEHNDFKLATKSEVDRLEQDKKELSSKIQNQANEINRLSGKHSQTMRNLNQIKKKYDTCKEDTEVAIKKLTKKKNKLETEMQDLRRQMEEQMHEIHNLKERGEGYNMMDAFPKEISEVIHIETDWIANNKFEALRSLYSVHNVLKERSSGKRLSGDEVDEKLVIQIEDNRKKHMSINASIMDAKPIERKRVIEERSHNLRDLLMKLDKLESIHTSRMDKLLCQLQHLTTYTHVQSGTKKKADYEFDKFYGNDAQYNELLSRKEEYKKQLVKLVRKACSYSDCLKKNGQEMMKLTEDEPILDSIEKEVSQVNEEIENLLILQDSYGGLKQQMKAFERDSCEVQTLMEQLLTITKKEKQMNLDCRKIDLEIDTIACDLDDEDTEEKMKNLNRMKEREERLLMEVKKQKQRLEIAFHNYGDYGEVRTLLPKSKSTGVKLKDYIFVRDVGGRHSNVKLYRNYKEEFVVLKKFSIDHNRRALMRESSRINSHHHLILPINNIFYHDDAAYVETPFIEGGTLRDWMNNGKEKTAIEIQNIIRLIAQGIQYLHDRGTIHCDLKPENILVKKNVYDETCIPILFNFGMSRNKGMSNDSMMQGGEKNKYMSPERLVNNEEPTTKADIWSLGVIALELISFPNDVTTLIATNFNNTSFLNTHQWNAQLQSDTSLYELLVKMFNERVKDRYDINDVLHHAFLNKVIDHNISSQELRPDSKSRINQIKLFIAEKSRSTQRDSKLLRVQDHPNWINSTLNCFYTMTSSNMMKRLVVTFEGEEGIDGGALTTAFYARIFNNIAEKLFEKVDNNNLFVPICDDKNAKQQIKNERLFESIGKVLIKMIFDQRTMSICLAPYFMRYLLCPDDKESEFEHSMIHMKDVDMVDAEFGRNMRQLLAMDDIGAMCLDFEEINYTDKRDVNNSNKHEFIKKKMQKKLFSDRMKNMKSIRRGFRSLPELTSYLDNMNERDMALLITDQQFIDRQLLLESHIDFIGDATSNDCSRLADVLKSLNNEQLQMLIYFATGQTGMFNGGSSEPFWNPNDSTPNRRNCITFNFYIARNKNALPAAHVCFYSIDMPKYNSSDIMKQKLIRAMEEMKHGGFTLS